MLLVCLNVFADDYRIVLINKGTVSIGGKKMQKGDTFTDKDIIRWESEQQAIKAINLTTKRTIVLAAVQMKKVGCSSLLDYVVFTNQLSVRDYTQSYSHTEQYLLDTLTLALPADPADITNIKIVYSYLGKKITKNLSMCGNDMVITRQLFGNINTVTIKTNVECRLKDDEEPFSLIEDMTIHLL